MHIIYVDHFTPNLFKFDSPVVFLGASLGTSDPEAPPTVTSSPRPLGDVIHAALLSKEYLGHTPGNRGQSFITRTLQTAYF